MARAGKGTSEVTERVRNRGLNRPMAAAALGQAVEFPE